MTEDQIRSTKEYDDGLIKYNPDDLSQQRPRKYGLRDVLPAWRVNKTYPGSREARRQSSRANHYVMDAVRNAVEKVLRAWDVWEGFEQDARPYLPEVKVQFRWVKMGDDADGLEYEVTIEEVTQESEDNTE